ncbi:hypothetical protein CPT_Seuss31 [Caulobacter phage Seuss]|uniref:Uncharacterized protein n=1 Tax=Caulobacter phage Seuss TaxID=1675601 RepID=A0A0K1LM13_9CAUD|nr:hypothetical protein HOR08_gp031 [Caulobacter phage Seuss]AKU43557.1 hypothetical protein CPT_Seuss31 [Caulobacter phage Seuss]
MASPAEAATHINNLVAEEKELLARRWLIHREGQKLDDRIETIQAHLAGVQLGQQHKQAEVDGLIAEVAELRAKLERAEVKQELEAKAKS